MMKNIITAIVAAGVFHMAYATTDTMHGNDPARAIMIKPNQHKVTFKLSANATTGYRWFLGHFNHRFLRYQSDHYIAPHSRLIGAPGMAAFTFNVKKPFHRAPYLTAVTFYYAQPWNLGTKTQQKLYVISIPGKPGKMTQPTKQKRRHPATPITKHQKPQIPPQHLSITHTDMPKAADLPSHRMIPHKAPSNWLTLPGS
jgi:predicted secreted protein